MNSDQVIPGSSEFEADLAVTELFGLIEQSILNQPRSLQKRIGPSEIGIPCDRRIGHILAGTPRVKPDSVAWLPFVGTALHEAVGNIVARAEIARFDQAEDVKPRWHVEERVTVGQIGGVEITGSCDLFDEATGLVLDYKFVTRNKIRETYRPHGPGEQYRTQVHAYGKGFEDAGYDVQHVAVLFWTRDGQFTDRHLHVEPYDRAIAEAALARVESIQQAITLLGPEFALPTLAATESHCNFCPWQRSGATDLTQACPGVTQETTVEQTLADLLK